MTHYVVLCDIYESISLIKWESLVNPLNILILFTNLRNLLNLPTSYIISYGSTVICCLQKLILLQAEQVGSFVC
jgi:hypothetical protein